MAYASASLSKLRVTTHDKALGTVEIRIFTPTRSDATSWHRAGTLCVGGSIWRRVLRPILLTGCAVNRVTLTLDESRATRESGVAPSSHHP